MATKVKKVKKYTFQEWAELRAANPYEFTFTPEGNGFIPAKEAKKKELAGRPEQTIEIPMYGRLSSTEQNELWSERQRKFGNIYKNIEIAKENLRVELENFESSKDGGETGEVDNIRDVVQSAMRVAYWERKLTRNRTKVRWIEVIDNPPVNYIDLENKTETRHMEGMLGIEDVFFAKRAVFPTQEFLKEVDESEGSEVTTGGGQETEYYAVTDDTVLGIHWQIDVQVGSVKYFTAYQAILGEIANQNDDKALFNSILGTRSKRTLHLLTKGLSAHQIDPEIMDKVIDSLLKREDFRNLLLSTGTKGIVYAEEEEPLFGIGLDSEDPNIQNTKRWRGENLWGKALEDARARLREKSVTNTEEESKEIDPVMASVISEAEQVAARRGAIIHQRRFKH